MAELSINSDKTSNLGLTCSYYDLTLLIEIYSKACLVLSPAAILASNSIGVCSCVCVLACVCPCRLIRCLRFDNLCHPGQGAPPGTWAYPLPRQRGHACDSNGDMWRCVKAGREEGAGCAVG